MDVMIEVRAWNLGFDEAEELTQAIADLCGGRRLALRSGAADESVRCIVSLKPQGGRMDSADGKAAEVVARAARGAQLMIVPSEGEDLVTRR